MRHNKGLETTAEPGGGPRQGRTSCVFPGSGEPGLIVLQAHPLPGARGVTRTTRGALVSVTDPGSVRTTDIPGLAGAGCGRGGQEAPARSLEREGAASSSAHRPSARSLPRLQSAARKPPRCDQQGGEGARGGERSGVKRAPRPPGLQWEELRARGEGSGAEGREAEARRVARSAGRRWREGDAPASVGLGSRRKAGSAAGALQRPGRPRAAPRPPRPAEGAPGRGGAERERRHRRVVSAGLAGGRRGAPGPPDPGPPSPRLGLPLLRPLPPRAKAGAPPGDGPTRGWRGSQRRRIAGAGRRGAALRLPLGAARKARRCPWPPGRLLRRRLEPRSPEHPRPPGSAPRRTPRPRPPLPRRTQGRRLAPAGALVFLPPPRPAHPPPARSPLPAPPRPPSVPGAGFMNGGKRPHAAAAASC